MKIKFYTNVVFAGWTARDLETGIGGSEEKLIELAKELAKKHDVTIYHNGEHGDFDGVKYRAFSDFKSWEDCDMFVSFKNKEKLGLSINANKIVHWTTEIEPEWPTYMLDNVDNIVCISDYQKRRMGGHEKAITGYLWADTDRLNRNKVEKEEGSMLYSSSFDRGLEELLGNWGRIKEALKLKKLYITYGWDFIDSMIRSNPQMIPWKNKMEELMKQEGVELLGRLSNDEMCKMYWKSQYWCLPLSNPDSELFCINAIKAQYCNAIPVVRRIGALQETVHEFIDWDSLLGQKVGMSNFKKSGLKDNKKFAAKFNLHDKVKEWETLMK